MTEIYPITPPPELVQEWMTEIWHEGTPVRVAASDLHIANQAARWGADQELEACCEWFLSEGWHPDHPNKLRAARRPKSPSLKEQALKELKDWTDEKHGPGGEVHLCEGLSVAIIRRALESLPD